MEHSYENVFLNRSLLLFKRSNTKEWMLLKGDNSLTKFPNLYKYTCLSHTRNSYGMLFPYLFLTNPLTSSNQRTLSTSRCKQRIEHSTRSWYLLVVSAMGSLFSVITNNPIFYHSHTNHYEPDNRPLWRAYRQYSRHFRRVI